MSLLLLLAALLAPSPAPAEYKIDLARPLAVGYSWQYRSGLMERVALKRGIPLYKGTIGFVSVPDCRWVGDKVYARIGKETGWWTIVDCSNPRHLAAQRLKHLVIEASGRTAIRGGWDYYTLDGPGHIAARVYGYKEVLIK